MGQLIKELKRRNVIRVAIAYAIAAWLLIEVSATTFPILRLPDWTATFVAVLLIVGFPVALIFAWAFELTPEGIKLEKHVVRDESITHLTGRKLDYLIIAALVLALGYFAFDKFVLGPSRDAELVQTTTEAVTEQAAESGIAETADKSIAVLAFADLSPEGDQEYFSDGISEELLNVLSKLPGLQVAARTSSFQFKGENRDIIEIGRQLNAALVLEGSVRKAGLQIRITAQLIDAKTGFHLWSESYDRDLEDIFAVQDEIAAAIVHALKEHLGLSVEAAPRVIAPASIEAHEAYLRGRYLMVQRTKAGIEGAVREFANAVELDPDYALAHAELAIATAFGKFYRSLTVTEGLANVTLHAERAMTLDPTLAEAHAAAGVLSWQQWNLEEALEHFAQAIRINPNYAIIYNWTGTIFGSLGRYEEQFAANETAVQLDPLSAASKSNYVVMLITRNQLDDAAHELEKLASVSPAMYASRIGLLTSAGGKWTNVVLGNLDALRIDPESVVTRGALAPYLAAIGLEREALAISEQPLPFVLIISGRPGDGVATAKARLAEDPVDLRARRDLGLALAGAGDYVSARPILEEMWLRSGGRVTCCRPHSFGLVSAYGAAALIAIRRDAGEEAEVDELLAAIRDNVRHYREAGFTRASLYLGVDFEEGLASYLAGERENGLVLIAKAVDDGYLIPPREAYLKTLYDDPGFAPIRATQEARQTRERGRFLAIVCTDNPFAAVWQPAEGTCDAFSEKSGN